MSGWGHSGGWILSQRAFRHMAGIHSGQVSSPSQDTDDPLHSQQKPFRASNQANVHVLSGGIPPWGTQYRKGRGRTQNLPAEWFYYCFSWINLCRCFLKTGHHQLNLNHWHGIYARKCIKKYTREPDQKISMWWITYNLIRNVDTCHSTSGPSLICDQNNPECQRVHEYSPDLSLKSSGSDQGPWLSEWL